MAEKKDDKTIFSLLEVTRSIQKTLSERYKNSFWVKAEMNKLNYYKHSGHCYPELVEKHDGKVIAQLKAHLWKDDYNRINDKFQKILKEPLKDGIKILFLAKISFDPAYGLALAIQDIDPGFTLGDLEREKIETINKLKDEGVFTKNKSIRIPVLPQRIAVISVETSKGYADFLKVIETNPWQYKFFHMLFPALLQGDKAVRSIIHQLKRIKTVINHFDVVAIIRGGGGDVGLSCYNNYNLAREIALFPIPVITGIGHATNETACELISHSNAITPTKLAEFLLQKFHNFSVPVHEAEKKIADRSMRLLSEQKQQFQSEVKLFRSVTENLLLQNDNALSNCSTAIFRYSQFLFRDRRDDLNAIHLGIERSVNRFIVNHKSNFKQIGITIRKDANSKMKQEKLMLRQLGENLLSRSILQIKACHSAIENLDKNVNNMNPINVLKRGYSITHINGRSIKSVNQIAKGDNIHTTVFDGTIASTVESVNPSENE
jgi:exodeoxyribonuclease VII large subunit